MKPFLRHIVFPLRRAWYRVAYDDHRIRLAKRQSRASIWTRCTFTMEFRRKDYAVLLKACRASKQGVCTFLQQAALQQARVIIEVKHSGRIQ